MKLLSKTRNTILYSNQRNNIFINLHRLQINGADVAVLAVGPHNYDENINRSIIQFAIKFIRLTKV